MNRKYKIAALAVLVVFIPSILAFAAGKYFATATTSNVPRIIPYDGTLEKDGLPISGSYNFKFELFDNKDTGTALWEEAAMLDVKDGKFIANLGSEMPLPDQVFDAAQLWLQITVSGNVLSPRQKINSVPFAVKAEKAVNVQNPFCTTAECNSSDFKTVTNKIVLPTTLGEVAAYCPVDYPIPVVGNCEGGFNSATCSAIYTFYHRNWNNPQLWTSTVENQRAGWVCSYHYFGGGGDCGVGAYILCRK